MISPGTPRMNTEDSRPRAGAAPTTALFALLLLAGCGQPADGTKSFDTRGLIREIAEDRRTAVIRHEEIPGYMPKMTMELTVRDTNELAGLVAGDEITFRLHATDETHWIDTLRKTGHQARSTPANAPSGADVVELKPGDPMPECSFLSEDGGTNTFAAFQGKVVAFTFIFTRCPLPDFCPLMNRSFARARELLRADPGATPNWHFLSLSFDSANDTPEVLRRYAQGYRSGDADRWTFGVLDATTLATLAPQLDLIVTAEGGSFAHNLRTVVLDPRGRIFRQFDHNQWTPQELADAMRAAGQGGALLCPTCTLIPAAPSQPPIDFSPASSNRFRSSRTALRRRTAQPDQSTLFCGPSGTERTLKPLARNSNWPITSYVL